MEVGGLENGMIATLPSREFFDKDLSHLIAEPELKDHVVSLLDEYKDIRTLPLCGAWKISKWPDGLREDNKNKVYDQTLQLAKFCLFICGYFPEFPMLQAGSIEGLEQHAITGEKLYNYAYYVGNKIMDNTKNISDSSALTLDHILDLDTIGEVGYNFRRLAKSIFQVRCKYDDSVLKLPREARQVLIDVMNDHEPFEVINIKSGVIPISPTLH